MNLQSKKKLLILYPTRGKLYTTKQDSAELFGQRATYILSLSDSFHYHFMSFLLKGFLQILSSLARKSRKNLFNLFCVHYSFMSWQSWKARVAENYGQKVLQNPCFFHVHNVQSVFFHTENERQTCKNIQAFLIHSMHLLHH